MSNEGTKPEGSEEPTNIPNTKPHTTQVLAAVADKIRTSGEAVRDRVVNSMVEKKLAQRAELVEKALIKLKDVGNELKKLGPDQEHYVEGNDKPVRTYSKQRKDDKKKAEENKAKLERALETVLSGKDEKGADVTDEHWVKLAESVK